MAEPPLDVRGLIDFLRILMEQKAPIIDIIQHPTVLLAGLEELDKLVEMHEVKYAIVQQVQLLLITAFSRGTKGLRFDGHKLHTVFYGVPGVGKSKAARCIAKIWHGLGVTSELGACEKEPPAPEPIAASANEILAQVKELQALEIAETNLSVEQKAAWAKVRTLTATLNKEAQSLITACAPDPLPEGSPQKPLEEFPICVCGREDFVGEYQGHTAPKAYAFLMKNRGKVIIIEEAYLLYLGKDDSFGMEALTVINRFMDEHATEAIIIFTGYKDMLLSTIFTAQPGLKRRCQWVFEIKGYTPAGLASIFRDQIAQDPRWRIEAKIPLEKFFTKHLADFPAFGGDTERLAFQAKLAYSTTAFTQVLAGAKVDLVVTEVMLQKAFHAYKGHQLGDVKDLGAPESMYA